MLTITVRTSGVSNLPSHLVVRRGRKIAERKCLAFYPKDLTADIFDVQAPVDWMRRGVEELMPSNSSRTFFSSTISVMLMILFPPAIVAVRGQSALDNVFPCQFAKVVVRERPDALRRGELLVPTDVLTRGPYRTRTSWRHSQVRPSVTFCH
jgi:hypothetical protein